jgi:vacuolar-type H+-ATPase subunit E/Vma4
MGYPELARALNEEAERQRAELLAEANRAATDLVAGAHLSAATRREEALARGAVAHAAAMRRIDAGLRLDAQRARLVAAREVLAGLVDEATRRLSGLCDEALALRLCAELRDEIQLEGGDWLLTVDARHTEAARRLLGPSIPVVAGEVEGALATSSGRSLDNRLGARLARAWPALEPELVRLLFAGIEEAQ